MALPGVSLNAAPRLHWVSRCAGRVLPPHGTGPSSWITALPNGVRLIQSPPHFPPAPPALLLGTVDCGPGGPRPLGTLQLARRGPFWGLLSFFHGRLDVTSARELVELYKKRDLSRQPGGKKRNLKRN